MLAQQCAFSLNLCAEPMIKFNSHLQRQFHCWKVYISLRSVTPAREGKPRYRKLLHDCLAKV